MLDNLGGAPAKKLGSDAQHSSTLGSSLGAGTSSSTSTTKVTDSLYEDARKGTENAKGAAANIGVDTRNAASNLSHTGAGVLDKVKESVSSVFGGASTRSPNESAMDAGASSAIKTTDFTDGIHEDASRGIESVKGATARR